MGKMSIGSSLKHPDYFKKKIYLLILLHPNRVGHHDSRVGFQNVHFLISS